MVSPVSWPGKALQSPSCRSLNNQGTGQDDEYLQGSAARLRFAVGNSSPDLGLRALWRHRRLGPNDDNTKTPIKHVIVIYGENRSFDHLFATYVSPSGDKVQNLLSEGIVKADGSPGPNFKQALQYKASATSNLQCRSDEDRPLHDAAAAEHRWRTGIGQRRKPAAICHHRGRCRRRLRRAAAQPAVADHRRDWFAQGFGRHAHQST